VIPKDNEKDLVEIPDNVKKGLEIVSVTGVEEVLEHALTRSLVPIEWDQDAQDALPSSGVGEDKPAGVVKH
jgi:ATP-dependent Lon protease